MSKVSVLVIFCYYNEIPKAEYFIKKGGLFSSQFCRFKDMVPASAQLRECFVENGIPMVGIHVKGRDQMTSLQARA